MSITPKSPVIMHTGRTRTRIDVRLRDSDGVDSSSVDVTLEAASNADFEWPQMNRVSGSNYDGVWRGFVNFDNYSAGGKWYVDIWAWDRAYNLTDRESVKTFYVKRNIRLSANASPEPVRKGAQITVAGNLKRLTKYDGYCNWRGVPIRIEFKPAGATTWTYLRSATTNSKGNYARLFLAAKDGSWRARYLGSTQYRSKVSSADFVDVR